MSRKDYVLIAFVGVLLKDVVDMIVAGPLFHREWTPLNYLVPLGIPITSASPADREFLLTMLAVSVPFAWLGLWITTKRFRTIGWPLWLVILFFVPIANIVSFALAAIWPEAHEEERPSAMPLWLRRMTPSDGLGSAVLALVISSIISVCGVVLATKALGEYGWGLFAAIPFAQGAIAAFLVGVHGRKSMWQCVVVAVLSVVLTAAALLAVALEGAICIFMAAPIATLFAILGALLGYALQNRPPDARASLASLLVLILVSPSIMGAEAAIPHEAPVYRVDSSVVIDAPPAVVWRNVIRFPDLPPPTEAIFRAGIAYPERARIVGHGVGATRYCEFSTGDFVEPITVWQRNHVLAFRVARNPSPLRELSPYGNLETPHLHDYLVSKHGQFVLQALPGGRTGLIGTTWYQHHLWPASYWAMYSNAIIHTIHMRVLNQIKRLSEKTVAETAAADRNGGRIAAG